MPREAETTTQLEKDRKLVKKVMKHKHTPYCKVSVNVNNADHVSIPICRFGYPMPGDPFSLISVTRFENPGNRFAYRQRETEDLHIVPTILSFSVCFDFT